MNWDDEEFEVKPAATAVAAWDDDEEEEEPILDSWDVDSEEEREKERQEAAKKAEAKKAQQAKLDAKKKKAQPVDDPFDGLDPRERKEKMKQMELEADLNNAADLFKGLDVAGKSSTQSTKVVEKKLEDYEIFHPSTKADYEKLRKEIVKLLLPLAESSLLNYSSSLAIDLMRDLCEPMTETNVRKAISTLTVIANDKQKKERAERLAKAKGATGGKKKVKAQGAKMSSKFDDDTTNYGDFDDDDLDFM